MRLPDKVPGACLSCGGTARPVAFGRCDLCSTVTHQQQRESA